VSAAGPAEVRAFALRLLTTDSLEVKLEPPLPGLPDGERGEPLTVAAPGRPPGLGISAHRQVRVPSLLGMRDPAQRARLIHALANHELQAAELFAWALLAFPEAPGAFRRGLLGILADEQRHCRMYLERLAAHGVGFGDHPVTGHFWNHLEAYTSPLAFVCAMGLTFENANLDFAGEIAAAARQAGDAATAEVLQVVHQDEIRHVAFAWHWLRALAPERPAWEAYAGALRFPLSPGRARGRTFDRAAREAAGIDGEFIARLEASTSRLSADPPAAAPPPRPPRSP
jgi:uncharacterized ferritin-like protein (DUF455 family)